MQLTLQDYERMNVADALIPKTYASGEVIVQQGNSADGMFFLEMGICEVYVESGAGNRKKVKITYILRIMVNSERDILITISTFTSDCLFVCSFVHMSKN